MATSWGRAGTEPSLEDVMADPLVHLVMRRDGLTPDDVETVIEAVRRRHAQRREHGAASTAGHSARLESRDGSGAGPSAVEPL